MQRWATNISGENSMVIYHEPPLGHRETICHLCLRQTKLTREHIPPEKAFNECRRVWERFNPRTKGVDEDGNLRGPKQTRRDVWQGGFYVRTICRSCNNDTGATSAKTYVNFVRSIAEAPRLFDGMGKRTIRVNEDTLQIARQIAVMIIAIEDVRFAQLHDDLRRFARGDLACAQPPFHLHAFLVPRVEEAGTIVRMHARVDTFAPGCGAIAGEISMYPFGFVYAWELQHHYRPRELADITHWFTTTGRTERRNAWLSAPIAVTVLDSLAGTLGNQRRGPQIDTLPEP